jgi:flagellar basal body-associated protein FliL
MDNKKKKSLLVAIIYVATLIVTVIGSTFAYFSAMTKSEENAVNLTAAVYKLALTDDTSLIKAQIIPSAEKYVDLAINRLDEKGNFRKPYEENGKEITDKTVCIDDNLNEICSIYTFTVINPMAEMELPIQLIIKPTINTFTNMKYKVIKVINDPEKGYQVTPVTEAKWLVDDRYEIDESTGGYAKDDFGNKVAKTNFSELPISTIPVEGLNETLPKAKDASTPSTATYSIVMWVEEIHEDQTHQDSGQVFAGGIIVEAGGANGNGISGVFTAGGVDNE